MATKTLTHGDYTVGWVCALPKEQTAALAMLDEKHADLSKQQNDPNVYTLGSVGRHNVVIACLPLGMIGNNKAANVAAHMVSTFPSIKFGLMVGIGGGVPPKVRLGDVVVSKPVSEYSGVVQWDFGKAEQRGTFRRTGALNNPQSALLAALTKLESKHDMEGSEIPTYLEELKRKWPKLIPKYIKSDSLQDVLFATEYSHRREGEDDRRFRNKRKVIKRRPRDMRVHYGLIASGNQVIKDAIRRDDINKMLGGNVLCFEMEAAGLMNDFPCLVIRGICDYADSHKNKNWQEHAADVAAAFAKELLSVVPAQEVDMMPTIKSLHEDIEKISKDVLDIKQRQITQEENIGQQQRSQLHQSILNWLTPTDYSSQQSDFIGRRQEGTGEWLLASNKFQTWVDQPKRILFCPGIPGAGKTIATSIVVRHLHRRFRDDVGVGVAYVYCNFRQYQKQHPEDLLLSLLKQILRGVPSVPICVERLYEDHSRKGTRPTFEEITDVFFSVVAGFSQTFIIIDALDECNISDGARSKFMSTIFNIHARTHANIFATSRFTPDIEKEFKKRGADWMEIRASDKDVRRYLDGHSSQLRSFILEDPELEERVKATIVKAADGMFLLAKLHLDSLEDKVNLTQVKHALEKLPSGSDAYDQAYEEAMERVQGQKKGFRDLAIQALSWITCTKRPLAKLELQHALATTENASSIDKGNITEVELIVSVCAGLITVDEESGIIRLIRYTTQEFFERTQKSYFVNAQEHIAQTCITYLSFDEFSSGFCKTDGAFEKRKHQSPLYSYAAHYWGEHTKGTLLETSTLILHFLENEAKVAAANQMMFAVRLGPNDTMVGHHFGWQLGLGKTLLSSFSLQRKISIVILEGHARVVELFLVNSVANPNSTGYQRRTPLASAAQRGHGDVVRLLLTRKGIQAGLMDKNGRTPLWWAARNGQKEVVELLLGIDGVDLDSPDDFYQTPLSAAAKYGHEDVVKLLITSGGVNFNAKDKTVRHRSFWPRKTAMSRSSNFFSQLRTLTRMRLTLMVEHHSLRQRQKDGANPTLKDSYDWTPFLWASANGKRNVMHLLQATNDVRGNEKQTKDHNEPFPTIDTNLENENNRNGSTFEDYYIAWICTLPSELAAARGMMDAIHVDLTKHPKDDYVYLLGCISSHNIVVASAKFNFYMSPRETGSRILRTFTSVRAALLVGAGKGVPTKEHDIRLGDVVVGAGSGSGSGSGGLVQYKKIGKVTPIRPPLAFSTAISALESYHMLRGSLVTAFISEMRVKHPSMSAIFTSRPKQSDQLFGAYCNHVGDGGNCEDCDITQLISRPPRIKSQPFIHYGIISANPPSISRGARAAISMESGALGSETQTFGWGEDLPVLIIRGISSTIDSDADETWLAYAATTAAAYAKELLRMVPPEDILGMDAVTMAATSPNSWELKSPRITS